MVAATTSSSADSFITEDQVEEEVAHGLVGVPYHLAVVATRLSKAQRMMWDKTTTKTSALTSSDRSGPLCSGGLPSPAKLVTAEVKISIVIFLFAYLPRNTA